MSGSDQEAIIGRDGRCIGFVSSTRDGDGYVVLDENYNFVGEARNTGIAVRMLQDLEYNNTVARGRR